MSEWRDTTRIPRGMSDFKRWYRPAGVDPRKAPSDVDGILHNMKGRRDGAGSAGNFIMFEFKPLNGDLTVGQRITLQKFSLLPGCESFAVFDPYSFDESRAKYTDSEELEVITFRDGVQGDRMVATVKELNDYIAEWFGVKP